jgi:tRNA(Ile)-lysidine synthase
MSGKRRERAFTAEKLLQVLRSYPAVDSYVVGFSGGADSTALLHALNTVRQQLDRDIAAVHVNHGLHQDAGKWQARCEDFCRAQGIRLTCLKIGLSGQSGKGLEAEARSLRYRAIIEMLPPNAALLTAHHADDQAETVLLNLMRGSGVEGLSAMPESRPLGAGLLQRPLLDFTNAQLLDYLDRHQLDWIDDPSNQQLDQDRNFIRHEVIPLLQQRWPGIDRRLLLTRAAMADARVLLEKTADSYLDKHLCHPFVLELTPGTVRDLPTLKLVIRRWVNRMGAQPLPAYRLASFSGQLSGRIEPRQPQLCWDGWTLRLYQQRLWLMESDGVEACPVVEWQPGVREVDLGRDVGRVLFSVLPDGSIDNASTPGPAAAGGPADWPGAGMILCGRDRAGANSIRHRGFSKSLKKMFQAAGIPPWLRNSIPLCLAGGEIVAIGDWCFDHAFEARMKRARVRMQWCPGHPLLGYIAARQHAKTGETRQRKRYRPGPDKPAEPTGS